jgi:predicted PurR-regulated permease PerM
MAMSTPADRRSPMPVPRLLADAAGWTWRLLLLALAAYLLVWLMEKLFLLVLPVFAALLVTALLHPLVDFFRHHGLPRALATWATIIAAFAVLGGIGFFVVNRSVAEYDLLVKQVTHLLDQLTRFLANGPFHLGKGQLNNLQKQVLDALKSNRSAVAQGVITGVTTVGELATGAVLAFFVTFFLLYDGDRIWAWVSGLFPARARADVAGAGARAWARVSGYVRGTFLIAVFHGAIVALTLALMGAPLVAPLALLVFLGSFIPIVGAVVFGGLAALVVLVTQGWVLALIFVGVLIVDNQVEAHVLQPFLVGHYVRLHPLAIVLVIAGGGFLEGIPGAILAVPVVSAAYAAAQFFARARAGPPDESEPAAPAFAAGEPRPPSAYGETRGGRAPLVHAGIGWPEATDVAGWGRTEATGELHEGRESSSGRDRP